MDLFDYHVAAMRTKNKDLNQPTQLVVATLGVMGEFSEMVKKWLGQGHDLDRARAKKELGDCLWYLAACADALDTTLDAIAQENIQKLWERYPDAGGFEAERSIRRPQGD